MTETDPRRQQEAPAPWHTVKVGGWLTGFQHRVEAVDQPDAVHRAQFLFPDKAISYVGAVSYVPRSEPSAAEKQAGGTAVATGSQDPSRGTDEADLEAEDVPEDRQAQVGPEHVDAEPAADTPVEEAASPAVALPSYSYDIPQVPMMGYVHPGSDYGSGPTWYGAAEGYGVDHSADVPEAWWEAHSVPVDDDAAVL